MTSPTSLFSSLPEELLLSILQWLPGLRELYAMIATCKQLQRLALDLPSETISAIALRGQHTSHPPWMRPYNHFILVTTGKRLASWAVHATTNRTLLKDAMDEGLPALTRLALRAVPITLLDLWETEVYHCTVLIPLAAQITTTRNPNITGNLSIALWSWTIYGELFTRTSSLKSSNLPTLPPALDASTRFRYLLHCCPDIHIPPSRNPDVALPAPQSRWASQNTLLSVVQDALSLQRFTPRLEQFCRTSFPTLSNSKRQEPTGETLFAALVMTDRRALSILLEISEPAKPHWWLRDLHYAVEDHVADGFDAAFEKLYGRDPWFGVHIPSLEWDLECLLCAQVWYNYCRPERVLFNPAELAIKINQLKASGPNL